MKLSIGDFIVAEGSELECAIYTHVLLESLRLKNEADKKKEVEEWMVKFGNKTFEEIMRMEQEGDK